MIRDVEVVIFQPLPLPHLSLPLPLPQKKDRFHIPAYDIVWHEGLRVKLQQVLTSNHLINFIMELLRLDPSPCSQVIDKKVGSLN